MSSTQDTPMASAAAHAIPQQPVQDADLADQLRHVAAAANRLGCPDVADILGTLASTTGQVVFLPGQVEHCHTSGRARSWGAWDHLTAEDGWEHKSLPGGVREKALGDVTVFPPNHQLNQREES